MSMDRNVWVYGTGLLVIVGGCFAIGYTLLPTKPAFETKKVATVSATPEPAPQTPPQASEATVPKLVIEDITAEKVASTKPKDPPPIEDSTSNESSPNELDISVDTSKKSESGDTPNDGTLPESSSKLKASEPVNVPPIKYASKVTSSVPATKENKATAPPASDDSITLFRVRIDSIKPNRKEAAALVNELKDKGFSATVLPLAGGFVVQTGAFKDRKSAETLQRSLLDNGYDASISN